MTPQVRILVVDDHPIFAEALAVRLDAEPDLHVSAAVTPAEALAHLAAAAAFCDAPDMPDVRDVLGLPDVVILDADLGTALRLIGRIRAALLATKLVLVADDDGSDQEPRRIVEALRHGVSAWVLKDAPVGQLIAAIRGAMRGETWIPPRLLTPVLGLLFDTFDPFEDRQPDPLAALTPREAEVLRCLVGGLDRAAVADRLCLSPHTVRTHMQHVLAKLGVHSTLAAVALARRSGVPASRL